MSPPRCSIWTALFVPAMYAAFLGCLDAVPYVFGAGMVSGLLPPFLARQRAGGAA